MTGCVRVDFGLTGSNDGACVLIGHDMISISGVRGSSGRSWRPLIGAIVAFAIAAQTLLIAFGLTLPARADIGISTFELCQHDAQDVPNAPAGDPAAAACSHCIFCFAGSHHAAIGPPAVLFQRVDIGIAATTRAFGRPPPPRLSAHSIASPRGPPLGA